MKTNRGTVKRLGMILAAAALTTLTTPLSYSAPNIEWSNLTIEEHDADNSGVFGDSDIDFYRVGLRAENATFGGDSVEDACWKLEYDADLEDRGAFNFEDQYGLTTFDENGEGHDHYNYSDFFLEPGMANIHYYDILAKDVLGWETATVRMWANSGNSNEFEATVPVPEPATMALLGAGALTALGIRRFRDRKD